jgi:hypothetical protein
MTDPGLPQPVMPAVPALQFDRVESTADTADGTSASDTAGIACGGCGSTMLDEYYSIGGKSICAKCRASVEATRATSRTPKAFLKALGFGFGAALAGAAVYFGVVALLDAEFSIVTIFIGWMVGRAIQKALPGGGMRRYQLLAAVLTYFAIGAAYTALGVQAMIKESADKKQDSTVVVAQQGTSATASVAATKADAKEQPTQKKRGSALLAIGALIAFAFSLPVMTVFGSGTGGVLSALIIAIGIYQAWRMSGAPTLAITGPFRVGANAAATAGSA